MLNRDYYITKMTPQLDSIKPKLLVGMRGVGKSTIFSQIISKLKIESIADDNHILYINLEFFENEKFRDSAALTHLIKKKVIDSTQYFVFLDEVQYVPQFELMINSLLSENANISFFISSSNSRLLAEDLNSVFSGNCIRYYITSFSYIETCKFLNTDPKNKTMLFNYLKYGGIPGRFQFKKSSEVKNFLYSFLDGIFLRDIVMRLGVSDIDEMNHVIRYVVKNLGKSFSVQDIYNFLSKNDVEIPIYKLETAIDCLCKGMIIQKCDGYNVRANKAETGNICKYYLNDLSITFLYGFDAQNNVEVLLKNLVWLELKKRGYSVYSGVNGSKEFDFVAIKSNKTMFIQVKEVLEDGNSVNIEVDKLQGFDSLNQRYLLSLDNSNYTRKGVIHKNLITFLLEDMKDLESENDYQSWVGVE